MTNQISTSIKRFDAGAKTAGKEIFVADKKFPGALTAKLVRSQRARARIVSVQVPELPEGYYYFDAKDIPEGGKNSVEMIKGDQPVFADKETRFIGENIGIMVGPDPSKVIELRDAVKVEYEDLEPTYTIEDSLALKGGPIHGDDNCFSDYSLRKGDPDNAFARAAQVLEDELTSGYQEQLYMEPQGIVGTWEDEKLTLYFSGQCPFYLRHAVAAALGLEEDDVRVRHMMTGGAFGGKEHYPDVIGTPLAVATIHLKKSIRLIFDRIEDISYTVKRHPSAVSYRTALDEAGNIIAMDVDVRLNSGAYETCSMVVLQRAIYSANSVYDIPNVKIRGRALATNMPPSDAFRGFGAPQGLYAAEMHMSHIARALGRPELEFKESYLIKKGGITVTNGRIWEDVKMPEIIQRVDELSGYRRKVKEYGTGGKKSAGDKKSAGGMKGIGISLFNHGSGFTGSGEQEIINGVVRLRKDRDGTVELLLANIEMGQGPRTTLRKVAAMILDLPIEKVVYRNPDTDRVPDSGPTCASRTVAVVGYLIQEAAKKLKERWDEGPEVEVSQQYQHPAGRKWNGETLQGDAYPVYGWGASVVEVEIDPITYEIHTTGVWAVFDVGTALDRRVVDGQIEGGMVQGLGYANIERLEFKDGRYVQNTMADYCIPTTLDYPSIESDLVDNPYEYGPYGAKGAGELVFDGAAPAFADAVQMAVDRDIHRIPISPEHVMEVIENGND